MWELLTKKPESAGVLREGGRRYELRLLTDKQYNFSVEQFAKHSDAKWVLTEHESPDALLTLAYRNFQI